MSKFQVIWFKPKEQFVLSTRHDNHKKIRFQYKMLLIIISSMKLCNYENDSNTY